METFLFSRRHCEPAPICHDFKPQLPPWVRKQHWLRDRGHVNTNEGHPRKKRRNRRGKRYYNGLIRRGY